MNNPPLISNSLPTIGWREFVALPHYGIPRIKAKVDTGARSSSLHAAQIERFRRAQQDFVRFVVYPLQRKTTRVVPVEERILDVRPVRSSSGQATDRIFIAATVALMGQSWEIELTLADRTEMGFRMLLGREAIRGRFLVDSGNSYYGGTGGRRTTNSSK